MAKVEKSPGFDYPKMNDGFQLPTVSEVIQKFEYNKQKFSYADALFETAHELRNKFWVPAECPALHYSVIEDLIVKNVKDKEFFTADRILALTTPRKRKNKKKEGSRELKEQVLLEWEEKHRKKLFSILSKVAVKQDSTFDESFYDDQKKPRKLSFYPKTELLLETESVHSNDSSDMVDEEVFNDAHCLGCNCFNQKIRFLNTETQTEMACHFHN